MLRAIGMTRRQVRRMIRHESVITALIGGVLGIVLGDRARCAADRPGRLHRVLAADGPDHRLRDRDDRGRDPRRDLPGAACGQARSARSPPVRVASTRARHALRRRPPRRASERAGDARAGGPRRARSPARRSRPAARRGGRASSATSACRRWPARRRSSRRSATFEAELSGLVLNERGWERLAATPLDRVNVTLAATESFNQRNGNASLEEATARVERILAVADRPSTATISVAFGCPFEGEVDPGVVAELAERLVAAGAGEVVLADTIGVATPRPVRRLVERISILGVPVGGHFHDTRHTGVANAWAAVEAGATVLDASVGGLGGCPFAPRATGNVATEDVLYLLDREGVETGRRPRRADRRGEVARGTARPRATGPRLPRRPLPSQVTVCYLARQGTRTTPASASSAISSSV